MSIVPSTRIVQAARIPREVKALLYALQLSGSDLEPLRHLSDQEWARLLEFCEIAQLTLTLAQLPMDRLPSWVVKRLETNLADNAQRFERVKTIYCEAAAALHRSTVEHIVFKGFTQAPDYVASPKVRAQSDLDFYCPPEQIEAAQTALKTIGYGESSKYPHADHAPTLVRLGEWTWKGNFFDPEMPLGIDLHFCLWNERLLLFSVPVDGFWSRRIIRTVDGITFPALHPVDHLGYLTLHILRNILRGQWIANNVRELAAFLHSHAQDEAFWNSWSEMHQDSLQSFEAIAFYHARAWFGCTMHAHAQNAIAKLSEAQLHLLSRISVSGLENMFRKNKDSIWLHMTFLTSAQDKRRILKRFFFPSKIASVASPDVLIRNKRLIPSSGSRWRNYLAYLISGSTTYISADITALWHCLCWRLSRQHLSSQFWTFLATSFFFNLGFSIYFFLINLFLVDRGYNEKSLGIFTSASVIGNLVGALPWGKLSQRIGLRPVLITCCVLAVSVSSARAVLISFPSQLVLAFLGGISLSAWAVCVSPVVAQLTKEKQRPRAFSILFSLGIGLGALGGLAGGRFPAWFAGHHAHLGTLLPEQLVLLGSCGIVVLAIWPAAKLRLTRPSVPEKPRPLLSPFLLRYLPAIAVWSLVTGSFSPLASVYLARHAHRSLPQIGNAFSLSQIVQVGATLLAPVLFRRWGLVTGIVFTQAGASVLLLALASSTSPLAATAAYVGFSALQWMNEPGLYSLLMNTVPAEDRSGASASNSLVGSASQAIAATLAGGAFVRYGYPAALRGVAVIALLAASLFWNLQGHAQRRSAPALNDVAS